MNSYKTYSDEQLLELLKRSDEAAFEEIYNRYWKRLLLKGNYLLKSNHDTEDIVTELFVTIWNRRHEIQLRSTFVSYVSAALKYQCLKQIAYHKSSAVITPESSDFGLDIPDNTTRELLDFNQLEVQLASALHDLPEKCKIIFTMSRDEGLTDKQIAQKLKLSTATVRTQKHRALTKLKLSISQFLSFLLF